MPAIHFLFVDDEEKLTEAVAGRLRLRGAVVDISLSGTDALNRLEKFSSIDIVVLDLQMPGEDGVGILKRIKEKYPLVEVIILTGNPSVKSAIDAIKCGAFDYLIKPYDLNDLLAKAGNAVARRRDRESKIFNIKSKPYILDEERNKLISKILEE